MELPVHYHLLDKEYKAEKWQHRHHNNQTDSQLPEDPVKIS